MIFIIILWYHNYGEDLLIINLNPGNRERGSVMKCFSVEFDGVWKLKKGIATECHEKFGRCVKLGGNSPGWKTKYISFHRDIPPKTKDGGIILWANIDIFNKVKRPFVILSDRNQKEESILVRINTKAEDYGGHFESIGETSVESVYGTWSRYFERKIIENKEYCIEAYDQLIKIPKDDGIFVVIDGDKPGVSGTFAVVNKNNDALSMDLEQFSIWEKSRPIKQQEEIGTIIPSK